MQKSANSITSKMFINRSSRNQINKIFDNHTSSRNVPKTNNAKQTYSTKTSAAFVAIQNKPQERELQKCVSTKATRQ